jgi:hypothetical protein
MPDVHDIYELRHLQNLARTDRRIKEIFDHAIARVTLTASRIKFNGTDFILSKYPQLQRKVNSVIQDMRGSIYTAIVNSIEQSWGLSNEKNDVIVDRRLAGKRPKPKARQILYDPNKQALAQFIKRNTNGLNLSKRVWNLLEPFKPQLELALGLGISEGKSAAKMATDIKQYLNEPDKLFRRVRDKQGKLRLSEAAKNYHPGQGIYRSSYKNALRLSRTENNMAYRTADHDRWNRLPFVTGVIVRLSANHPRYDICDVLAGKYPKNFKFVGWHPQCMCYAVPQMMSDAEYEKYEDKILGIGKLDERTISRTVNLPTGMQQYIKTHDLESYKNKPYWVKDNPKYIKL